MPTYEDLQQTHPEYNGLLWKKARALHTGGPQLLDDEDLLTHVFPPHIAEHPRVYDERRKRSYYIPYAGEIINSITAGVFSEQLSLRKNQTDPDEYWEDFFGDCSPPGGEREALIDFLRQQLTTALLCRQAWTLIDFPAIDPDYRPSTLAEEESQGLDRAYVCKIDPEQVLDWECDPLSGELQWAIIHRRECSRKDISSKRDQVTESWTLYTATSWERYEVTYPKGNPPRGKEIPRIADGAHSFGRVPLVRLDVGEELWIMAKIMSLAIAHFNQRNALSWAEYKSLFPVLVAFKGPIDHLNPETEDPDRDKNQTIGQGYILSMADKDRVEYVGPDSSSYDFALQDLQFLRDEMHRVVHQMAMSVDNSGAALRRSADSKQADMQMTSLLLAAYAEKVKEHALRLIEMIDIGRSDDPDGWEAQGMDSYDEMSTDALMAQAETIDTISIPSATFQKLWKYRVAQRSLGEYATEENLTDIYNELDKNISNEDFLMPEMEPGQLQEEPEPSITEDDEEED